MTALASRRVLSIFLACFLVGCEAPRGDAEKKADPPKADKSTSGHGATHKVEKGPFKVELSCKGVFEAAEMAEVSVNPEAWTPNNGGQLVILKAVEHGAPVRKGDVLIAFDLDKLNERIRNLEAEQGLNDLAISQAEREIPILERSMPLEQAVALRAKQMADEDLRRFLDQERDMLGKMAEHFVKQANDYLDYAKDELKQLEKMYREKDLTEETEEIILKRTRTQVERATFYVRMAEFDRDLTLKVELPRREQKLKDGVKLSDVALTKAQTTLPLTLQQKQLHLKKLLFEREKSGEQLAKLRKDRDGLIVKAPADGIVFHGKCERGQWSMSAASSKLHAGGQVQPHEVMLTVVKARPIFVRATVDEKDLPLVRAGAKGKVVPTADPDVKLPAKVDKVSDIPVSSGTFEARIALDGSAEHATLMPGMACTVKFVPYAKAELVSVPASAVFTDELDDDKHYVYFAGKDGKHEKRTVVVGRKSGDRLEIKDGLKDGDEILLEKPGKSKKEGA